jgi:hypothetical protein
MKGTAFALLALTLAAPAQAQEPQQVVNVYRVAPGAPVPEQRVPNNRSRFFLQQELIAENAVRPGYGIQFDLTPSELDALRNRHDMHDEQPFILAEWIAVPAGGAAPRHLGFLHCSLRIRTFVGMVGACLRDRDEDGRLDGAATFVAGQIPAEGLQFAPIEPVGYRYVPQPAPIADARRMYDASLALSYEFNRRSNRLKFMVNPVGLPLARFSAPSVEVDPARLPVSIELGGAAVTVLAWDGRRATLRVDRPFPASLVRIFTDGEAWRLDYYDQPLPGAGR